MNQENRDGLLKKIAIINFGKILLLSFLSFLIFYIPLSAIAIGEGIATISLMIPLCIAIVFSIGNIMSILNIKSLLKNNIVWESSEHESLKLESKNRQVVEEKIRKNLSNFNVYEEKSSLKTIWIGISSLNVKSFGEIVLVILENEQSNTLTVQVSSTSVIPFTRIDWGKNAQNIKRILSI